MRLAKTFLAIGIAVIFAVFIGYGLYVIYEHPKYGDCYGADCYEDFGTRQYEYYRNSFFILIIIGTIALVAGILLSKMEGIGSGLMGGGILVILWSLAHTWEYWSSFNKYLKLGALGIVLIILIYLGYRKLERKETPIQKV
jgi:hypothetical protein